VNSALLARLRSAGGGFVSLSELGTDLRLLSNDLDELADFGHVLERHPYLGVAYRAPAARLCPDQIEWQLGTKLIGRRLAVWDRVSSTNDLAAAAARSRTNDGLVILAEGQSAGRGRRGRTWTVPSGTSLLMSVLLFPSGGLEQISRLMALGAVAVAELVADLTGREARIKWPNDVRVDGRKIAGILVERGAGVVIGIGLNVNVLEHELPESITQSATSLRILTGASHDRSEVARDLIQRLDQLYILSRDVGSERLDSSWSSLLEPLGREVSLSTTRGDFRGKLVEADLAHGLSVQGIDGVTRVIEASEILGIDTDEEPRLDLNRRDPLPGQSMEC
jgi:BirA family biotin operon repressor/biotin-[acetyl-CoA-carboxylase] ligase